jgi:hypothetical protein
MTEEQVRIIKLHKRWADRYTLGWLGFAVLLLTRLLGSELQGFT